MHVCDRSEQEPRHPEAACHSSQGSVGPSRPAALTAPWPPHPGFPEERGQAGQEWPPPSSTAKNVLASALPALHPLPTSPHSSLSPRNTHTCTHTPQPLFHTAHLSSQAPLWLPGLEGSPWIIWLTSPHSELPLGCLLQDPCQDFSIFFLHTSKDRELTTSQARLLFGPL